MGWKCIPQVIGLVRGDTEAKHRANGLKICKEAGKERATKSETIDRTRSKYNRYLYQESGKVCWEQMEQAADEYRITGVNKNGKEFSRKLRSDAVIGWAMIFKPPVDVVKSWDEAKKKKFRDDSWIVMMKIEPRLFRKSNLRMVTRHRDEEGDHDHFIGDAKDKDGRYCGNLIDFNLLTKINEQYPAMMRELGWDIEDVEITDWVKYAEDLDYRIAVNAKKAAGPGGMSVNEYRTEKVKERAEQVAAMYKDAQAALKEARATLQEAQEAREDARGMKSQADRVKAINEAVTASQRALPGQHRSELEKQLQGI